MFSIRSQQNLLYSLCIVMALRQVWAACVWAFRPFPPRSLSLSSSLGSAGIYHEALIDEAASTREREERDKERRRENERERRGRKIKGEKDETEARQRRGNVRHLW